MKKTENISAAHTAIATMAHTTSATFPEGKTMTHNTTAQTETCQTTRMTTALRDGLITLAGLGIAAGSIMNQEITMWWVGA